MKTQFKILFLGRCIPSDGYSSDGSIEHNGGSPRGDNFSLEGALELFKKSGVTARI